MNKRFASLAVSALLLVSLLSVPALAEGTEAAADAAGDDHVIVTLNPEAALQPETPSEAAAAATETAQADPVPSAYDAAWLPTSMATLPTAMSARWLQLSASTVTTPSTSACRP